MFGNRPRYTKMKMKIPFIIFFGLLAVVAFGFVVMYLWNAVLPDVLHVSTITFWQALGILVLSKILFGGFRGGWGRHNKMHGGMEWRKKMEEKLRTMSPEEREKFTHHLRSKWPDWKMPEFGEGGSEKAAPTE